MIAFSQHAREQFAATLASRLEDGIVELRDAAGSVLSRHAISAAESDGATAMFTVLPAEATSTGRATSAAFIDGAGLEVISGDVGPRESDAFLRMNDQNLLMGGTVAITDVRVEIA